MLPWQVEVSECIVIHGLHTGSVLRWIRGHISVVIDMSAHKDGGWTDIDHLALNRERELASRSKYGCRAISAAIAPAGEPSSLTQFGLYSPLKTWLVENLYRGRPGKIQL